MRALAIVALALLGCNACHGGPITIQRTTDDNAWSDASDLCKRTCDTVAAAKCPVDGIVGNPACAPACRIDQAQGVGAQFPIDCILDAGANHDALAGCGVSCP